jgi:hypothetical protein
MTNGGQMVLDIVELEEREDPGTAMRDARRGLVFHAAACLLSLVIHYALIRRAQRGLEETQMPG